MLQHARGCFVSRIHMCGTGPGRGERARSSGLCRWHKPVTTGDGRHLQVKRSMLGMTALIQQCFARLLAAEDGNQRWRLRVILSEVTTEPTLTVMNRLHSYTSICH